MGYSQVLSFADYIESDGRVTDERRSVDDLEESGSGIIEVLSQHSA